jgi:hypothetical protein
MTEPLSLESAEAEFDMMTTRAGVVVPADRRAALLEAFRDFREQIAMLHTRRSHVAEISNIFTLVKTGTKTGGAK